MFRINHLTAVCFQFQLLLTFLMNTDALALSADDALCVSRALPKPEQKVLVNEALSGFGMEPSAASQHIRRAVEKAIGRSYSELSPKDTLCIVGEDADPGQHLNGWKSHGGTLMIIGGKPLKDDFTLDDQISSASKPFMKSFTNYLSDYYYGRYSCRRPRCGDDIYNTQCTERDFYDDQRSYDNCLRDQAEDSLDDARSEISNFPKWMAPKSW